MLVEVIRPYNFLKRESGILVIVNLSCTRNCKPSEPKFGLVEILQHHCLPWRMGRFFNRKASQETCHMHGVTNFREKRFGYGSSILFPDISVFLIFKNEQKFHSHHSMRNVCISYGASTNHRHLVFKRGSRLRH